MNPYLQNILHNITTRLAALEEALANENADAEIIKYHEATIARLQEALAKQEQGEPRQEDYLSKAYRLANELRCHLAIAPAPQQRTWVGLTDEEIDELHGSPMELEHSGALKWVRIIEAKLKEKNT
jgi:hypothetical protein